MATFSPARWIPLPKSCRLFRRALEQFLAIGLPITMNVCNVYVSGDIALVVVDWSLKGTGADGSEVDMSGATADVARRGPDGWKFVIDNPFGTN
ncbi:MAG TPA: hypothetical protein VI094_10320 [Propionibacteriaceae bacterium]